MTAKTHSNRPLRFEARIFWARLSGALSGAWPALWPFLPLLLTFMALGLLGLWRILPLWLHLICLAGLSVSAGYTAYKLFKSVSWPSREAALVELERVSALKYQPLRKTGPLSHGDERAQRLWQAHIDRLNAKARQLKSPMPQLSHIEFDPMALRLAAVLLFVIGLAVAGRDSGTRLAGSFIPELGGAPADADVTFMVTPPDYTGLPPLLLSAIDSEQAAQLELKIPAGSKIDASLEGGWRTPQLEMGARTQAFGETSRNSYRLETQAAVTTQIIVRQGSRAQFTWPGPVTADAPPAIAFSDLPERTTNHALRIGYELLDDYGVETVALALVPRDEPKAGEAFGLPAPRIEPDVLSQRHVFKDLTKSKWAGRPVSLSLLAVDGLGQEGQSGPLEAILPERPFKHPLAQKIISQRKRLFFEQDSRPTVAHAIEEYSRRPSDFGEDLWVFSMLRSTYYRLRKQNADIGDATDQMWEIALWLEDGGLSASREALREALEDMMSALQNADSEEFNRLSQQLEARMADLMRQQMEQMRDMSPQAQMEGGEMRIVDGNTLERMMQQMRDLAASGDMAGAMEMLQAIQSLMENLQMSPGPSQEMMAQAQAAEDALEQLNELIDAQRSVMNDTVKQALDMPAEGGQTGQQPQGEGQSGSVPNAAGALGGLAGRQQGLAEQGQSISEGLQGAGVPVPSGLPDANANMGNAQARLSEGRGLPALRQQSDALKNLRAAQSQLEQQLDKMMQQMRSMSAGRDPLGRPTGKNMSNGTVKIPTEAEAKKARAIREELQRRLADPNRSVLERTYLRRLLERFRP